MKRIKGFSLFEVLVVLGVVGIVGLVASSSLITTLRGVKRTDSDSKVKQNLNFALTIMERHLRNSQDAVCTLPTRVDYEDANGLNASFFSGNTTINGVTIGYIASNSATTRLTGSEVNITSATFTCTAQVGDSPASITIELTGEDANASGVEKSQITTSTKVFLRSVL